MWDSQCKEVVRKNINMTVPWYLMSAYAYYHQDDPILTDETFDMLGRMMIKEWDKIKHRHKEIITEGDLKAGTCLIKLHEYPRLVIGALGDVRGEATKLQEKMNEIRNRH